MKIVHITESYIEGWGYQENLLPLYQKKAGHDVVVISNNNHLVDIKGQPSKRDEILARGNEYIYDGIKIYKIKTFINFSANTSFLCKGLYRVLEKEKPDMIFHHNVGTAMLTVASRYKRNHPNIKLYVDNHVDWINVSKNWIWHLFYYELTLPMQVKLLGDTVDYYIGVSPMRCQFLNKVFNVPRNKIRFLPIGCDTELAGLIEGDGESLRAKYDLCAGDFVIVTGGKLDRSKGTLELIDACKELRQKGENIKLVLFGKIDDEVNTEAKKNEWVKTLGWCDRITTLSLLKMADVACWPWLHTTLIEDSVAIGTPLIVKMSDNVSHFAREEAGLFLTIGNKEELKNAIEEMKKDNSIYRKNVIKARDNYSYKTLVQRLDDETFCDI